MFTLYTFRYTFARLRSQLQVRTRRSYTERAVNVPRFEISEDRKRGGGRTRPRGRAKATRVVERSKLALKATTLTMKLQGKQGRMHSHPHFYGGLLLEFVVISSCDT